MLKHTIIIGFFIGLWAFLSLLYIFNYNLTLSVISYSHSKSNFHNFTTNRLLAGDKISGEFKAKEDHLGIVSISFSVFQRVSYNEEDTLVFRLKEKGAKDWYYEGNYKSGLIYQVPFLPLGFPEIENSKDKIYEFELQSLRGNKVNAVALNSWEPVLVSRYQMPKDKLIGDENYLIAFFTRKIFASFDNQAVLFFSFIYSLPLWFYLLLQTPPVKKNLKPFFSVYTGRAYSLSYKVPILGPLLKAAKDSLSTAAADIWNTKLNLFLIAIVLVNIFIVPEINDIALVIIMALWVYILRRYRHYYKESFVIGILLILISPVALQFDFSETAEKAGVWAYMFFLAGTIQIVMELREEKLSKIDRKARKW